MNCFKGELSFAVEMLQNDCTMLQQQSRKKLSDAKQVTYQQGQVVIVLPRAE
jgi:hypothetical protein